ncbi:MAG TPA: histidine kinase [Chitinophagaceae bacterium]|nr:histidine kinase [Chitinophagaceae bacterium]
MPEKHLNWHDFIFSNLRGERMLRHFVFWLAWWIYFAGTYHYYVQVGQQKIEYNDLSKIHILQTFILLVIHMVSCYYFIYSVLPHFLAKRNYSALAAEVVLLVAFLLAAGYFTHTRIFTYMDPSYCDRLAVAKNTFWWISINSGLLTAIKIIATASVIVLAKIWYLKQKEEGRILNEKYINDLKLLRAQVRPEFLFASLEHIYQYARNKSPQTMELLLKFSDLLSYLLYECDEAKLALDKELSMMKEYMTMEKMRFDRSVEMEIAIKGDADNKTIAPLLLLPFIENSFIQCKSAKEQAWINLELSIDENVLTMKLMNGVAPVEDEQPDLPAEIVNVKKRLQLLYPDHHELKIYKEQEISMTLLKITLIERYELPGKGQEIDFYGQGSTYNYALT